MRIGMVIPAKDEEKWIIPTLQSLVEQPLDAGIHSEIVVVENGSDDGTAEVVAQFAESTCTNVTLLSAPEPSAIGARIMGMQHLTEQAGPVRYLVSGDADTIYPPGWLDAVVRAFQSGADLVSCAGYMDSVLWQRCPRVAQRYVDEIGSIFFDPQTISDLDVDTNECLFTHQVYADFGRPLVSPGFAITSEGYQRLGGFRREYYDADGKREILIAALPLMFRADMAGLRITEITEPWWSHSPRRLLAEPDVQLGRKFQHTDMETFRGIDKAAFRAFDDSADQIDYHGLRLNCARDYVLTPCVVRPERIDANPDYFGDLAEHLIGRIAQLHGGGEQIEPRHVFDLAAELTDEFGDKLLECLRQHRLRSRRAVVRPKSRAMRQVAPRFSPQI